MSPDTLPSDGRSGRPFTFRLRHTDRVELERLMELSEAIPWGAPGHREISYGHERPGYLGSFIVWAAKQWRPLAAATVRPRRRRPGKTRRARAGKTKKRIRRKGRR